MNKVAIAGLVGGGIGAVKGIVDEKKDNPNPTTGSYIGSTLSNGIGIAALAAGGAGIISAVKNPESVAKAISGSKITESNIYKTIIPGKKQLTEEVATRMSGKTIINSAGIKAEIDSEILEKYRMMGVDIPENISKAFEDFGKSNLDDKAFNELNEALKKDSIFSGGADSVIDLTKDISEKYKSSKNVTTDDVQNLKWYQKAKEYTSAYYLSPDKKTRNTRIAASVGAVSAASVGGRFLSGGTLTRDQYGQKDIAGIPFI